MFFVELPAFLQIFAIFWRFVVGITDNLQEFLSLRFCIELLEFPRFFFFKVPVQFLFFVKDFLHWIVEQNKV